MEWEVPGRVPFGRRSAPQPGSFSMPLFISTLAIFRILEQIQWFSGSGLEALSPCFAMVFFCKWPKSSSCVGHDPGADLAADVPGGVVPDQGQDPGTFGRELAGHPGEEGA